MQGKNLQKPGGFYDRFERKPGPDKETTHLCPGCGHGMLYKLIAEALSDLDVQDRCIFVNPVGCGVFGYYYLDTGHIAAAHGRAPAVACGASRAQPEAIVIAYQGDGDLAAIGFNNLIQAANRGESITVFFVNNALYAMTGGQMAPTTLVDQVTTTTPYGRNPANDGYPLRVSEIVAMLEAPVYVERVALTDTPHIRATRRAVRKAIQNQVEHRGFSLIEVLSPCPTNWKVKPTQTIQWMETYQIPYFPLRCFKDVSTERAPIQRPTPVHDPDQIKAVLGMKEESGTVESVEDPDFGEYRCKFAGFGGQGILSLGFMVAQAGAEDRRFVTWLPSYGPEQRGGTANCSVVLAGQTIGSPLVSTMDLLVAMNQPSMERFIGEVRPGGLVLYDTLIAQPVLRNDVRCIGIPATEMANQAGNPRAANTAILGALSARTDRFSRASALRAIETSFAGKAKVIEVNRRAFEAGYRFAKTEARD